MLRGPATNKGARLTTHISLAGHYLVYMPTLSQLGVSRRIHDEAERLRLKGLLEEARPKAGGSSPVPPARARASKSSPGNATCSWGIWQRLRRKRTPPPCPSLLHQELEAARRVVRELYSPEVDRILVDDPAGF